jgi:hypothetical protein
VEEIMIVTCKHCNKEFNKNPFEIKKSKSGNHFCSSSCSASYNNSYRARKDRRPDFTCLNCKTTKKSSHNGQKYCNQKCQHSYFKKLRAKKLEAGENLTANNCKTYYLDKEAKCSCCNLKEWNGKPIPLELDHINGDGTDNTLKNTRLLCPNCHAQTDTYKSKNSDNPKGKEFRRKRYLKTQKG